MKTECSVSYFHDEFDRVKLFSGYRTKRVDENRSTAR